MSEMELDGVTAGVGHTRGRRHEVVADAGDVARLYGSRELHGQGTEDPAGRTALVSRGGGHGPGVAELHGYGRALGVDGFGQVGQAGRCLVGQHDLVGGAAAIGRHGAEGHGGHADPAPCDRPMELDQPLAHDVLGGGPFERGGLDDAVPEREGTELGGSEGVGCSHAAEPLRFSYPVRCGAASAGRCRRNSDGTRRSGRRAALRRWPR